MTLHKVEEGAMSDFRISTVKEELNVPLIHKFLSEQSTWANNIPYAIVQRSIANSLCFGGFLGADQVAFARVISDYATFANLVDVFVLPEWRGKGYSKCILQAVFSHPELQNLRRFMLATNDAHGLYAQFGFTAPKFAQSLMERYVPDIYIDVFSTTKFARG